MKNLQGSTPVIYKKEGKKYNFILEVSNGYISVKAIDKLARKCSFINNLNFCLNVKWTKI